MTPSCRLEPAYIAGDRGKLFALHCAPAARNDRAECVIVAPSFAEEMNRCRYMQTMLAQQLAGHGIALLSVYPFGTGDSQGEFVEADWQQWIRDIITAADYAGQLGYRSVTLLGIRLGALLAAAAAPEVKNLQRLVFWQPVSNGKIALNQFLRIKIAAAIGRDEDGGTTAQLEEELNRGDSIQVAGYDVSPALFRGIQAAHFDQYLSPITAPISWYTVLASAERSTPRADLKTIEQWRSEGKQIEHLTSIGPAFWQAHERTLAPNLVNETISHLTGVPQHE